MSFEEFRVGVVPKPELPLASGCDVVLFRQVVRDLLARWDDLRPDADDSYRFFSPKDEREEFLVHESEAGLFQVKVLLGNVRPDTISFHLRVAYSNPRTVLIPFFAVVEDLMLRYAMCATCSEPVLSSADARHTIDDAEAVHATFAPRFDFNKAFWHDDVQTGKEAILRPGDAVARFVTPQLIAA